MYVTVKESLTKVGKNSTAVIFLSILEREIDGFDFLKRRGINGDNRLYQIKVYI